MMLAALASLVASPPEEISWQVLPWKWRRCRCARGLSGVSGNSKTLVPAATASRTDGAGEYSPVVRLAFSLV